MSYLDDPASYDGLFTRSVRVEDCKFLPLTLDGKVYPCPNPIGAHYTREDHHYDDIVFTRNLIVDPNEDPIFPGQDEDNNHSSRKGVLHFPSTRDLMITDNKFIQHIPRSVRAISVSCPDMARSNSMPLDEKSKEVSVDPILSEHVTISRNQFIGFRPSDSQPSQEVISVRGVDRGKAKDVEINNNTFDHERKRDGRGTMAILVVYAQDLQISRNTVTRSAGGIKLEHTLEFNVSSNIVTARSGTRLPVAISVADGSHDGIVSLNTTHGFSDPVDTNTADGNIHVKQNT